MLDICMLVSLLPKTNIQVRCWTRCSNILAWFSVPCTFPCFTHAFIYLRNPRVISCWSSCVFLVQNQNICYFLKECYLLRKLWMCTKMFLMMCLHIRIFLIWFWLMWNGSPFVLELFWSPTRLYDPYCFSI